MEEDLAKILNYLVANSEGNQLNTDKFDFSFEDHYSEDEPDTPHQTGKYEIVIKGADGPIKKFTLYGVRSADTFYSPDFEVYNYQTEELLSYYPGDVQEGMASSSIQELADFVGVDLGSSLRTGIS